LLPAPLPRYLMLLPLRDMLMLMLDIFITPLCFDARCRRRHFMPLMLFI